METVLGNFPRIKNKKRTAQVTERKGKRDRLDWDTAARECGVALGELRIGIAGLDQKFNSDRWSKWNSGDEPVPGLLLIRFLRGRLDKYESRTYAESAYAPSGEPATAPIDTQRPDKERAPAPKRRRSA